MKKIKDLLNIDCDIEIKAIKTNSSEVLPGDLFLCTKGVNVDRHDYIDDAIRNGAVFLITEKDGDFSIPYFKVENCNNYKKELLDKFYDDPLAKIKLIGVTGTDGKTSIATIIQTLIGKEICGYVGTNGYSYKDVLKDTNNTTPDIEYLYPIIDEMINSNIKYLVLETSSEAFYHNRLKDLVFEVGVFSNIHSEHLNVHKTLENYVLCKKQLFKQAKIAILNSHSQYYNEFNNIADTSYSYGYQASDNLIIQDVRCSLNDTDFSIKLDNNSYHLSTNLLGQFNIENISASLLASKALGFSINDMIPKLSNLHIKGRMINLKNKLGLNIFIDYAHTPNGLNALYTFIKSVSNQRIISVIGQAGQRDNSKRKYVGQVVCTNSDLAIFTSEDPRFEDIQNIFNDMIELIKEKDNFVLIKDRAQAIKYALKKAQKGDIILVLGKGEENYQYIQGKKVFFNDLEKTKELLKEIN